MNFFILLFFILFSLNSYSNEVFIISSHIHHEVIENYRNKLPSEYIVRGIILNENSDESIIKAKIDEIKPDTIIFIGDVSIKKILLKYHNDYKQLQLAYCCSYGDYTKLEVSGITYVLDYSKFESIIKNFENIYILKSNNNAFDTIPFLLFENIKSVPVKIEIINSLYEIRKFFIKLPKNSVVINLLVTVDNLFDKNYISNEIDSWNKKSIVIDFYENGQITLIPDYNSIVNSLVDYTVLNKKFNYSDSLNFQLNYNKLIPYHKNNTFFRLNINDFDKIEMETPK